MHRIVTQVNEVSIVFSFGKKKQLVATLLNSFLEGAATACSGIDDKKSNKVYFSTSEFQREICTFVLV